MIRPSLIVSIIVVCPGLLLRFTEPTLLPVVGATLDDDLFLSNRVLTGPGRRMISTMTYYTTVDLINPTPGLKVSLPTSSSLLNIHSSIRIITSI